MTGDGLGSRRRLELALPAALCLLMGTAVAVLAHRVDTDRSVDAARRAALAAAPRIVRDVLSYDYRTIDADLARAKLETTGTFARQYAAAAGTLESAAIANRAIVQAQPQAPGIVTADADQVVVLIFVDQVVVKEPQGSVSPTTNASQSRVDMTLRKVGGVWRLAALAGL